MAPSAFHRRWHSMRQQQQMFAACGGSIRYLHAVVCHTSSVNSTPVTCSVVVAAAVYRTPAVSTPPFSYKLATMKSTAFFLILLAGSAAARTLNGDAKPAGLLDGILNPILGGNGTGGGVIGGIIGGDGGGIGGIIGGGGGLGGLVGGLLNGTLGGILPGLLPGNVLNTTSGLIPIGNIPIGNLIGGGGVLGGSGLDLTKTLGPLLGGILNGQLGGPLTGPILNQTLGQILGPGINISLTVSVQGAPCTALLQQRVRKALGAFVTKTLVFVKVDTTKCTASNVSWCLGRHFMPLIAFILSAMLYDDGCLVLRLCTAYCNQDVAHHLLMPLWFLHLHMACTAAIPLTSLPPPMH